jgi:sugar phosphate isomerase/epimerase
LDREKAFEQMLPWDAAAPREMEPDTEAGGEETVPAAEDATASSALENGSVPAAGDSTEAEQPKPRRELVFPLCYPVPLALLRERIPFLLDHGLNVEVDLSDTTYNSEVQIRDLERLAIELRRSKIKVIAGLPHYDLKLASRDRMILQHSMDALQEGLEIGKILGGRIAIFRSGFSNHVRPQDVDGWVEKCIEGLEDLVSRAQEEEVIVALQNTWESDEQVIVRLFDAVDSPWFRFCADLGMAACFSQFAPEDWVVQFRERIAHMRFHDNNGMVDTHLACGQGVVGYDLVAETAYQELTEPVHITLDVAEHDLVPSIEHLRSVGFRFDLPS